MEFGIWVNRTKIGIIQNENYLEQNQRKMFKQKQ